MKIRLKLKREEYKGVATIVQNCCNALGGTDFESVQYRDCLLGMQLKMAGKMLTLGRKTTLTLTDMEALVLHNCINESVHLYQPYEMSLGYMILAKIDQQCRRHVSLMMGNLGGMVTEERLEIKGNC